MFNLTYFEIANIWMNILRISFLVNLDCEGQSVGVYKNLHYF